MHMRQHKRLVQAKVAFLALPAWYSRPIYQVDSYKVSHTLEIPGNIAVAPNSLDFKLTDDGHLSIYYCKKVKDDDMVGAFNTRREALTLLQKHARQRKAKLYVMHKGEQVIFTEEELESDPFVKV